MQLGDQVRGLMMAPTWRFVTADSYGVCRSIEKHDPNARLVANPDDDMLLAVARWVEREHLGEDIDRLVQAPVPDKGGAYMLVFHPKREDGSYMYGEPDPTVLTQLQERDLWARRRGVNARQMLRDFEKMHEARMAKAAEALAEQRRAKTEERLHGWARKQKLPWKPGRIVIPKGVKGGR